MVSLRDLVELREVSFDDIGINCIDVGMNLVKLRKVDLRDLPLVSIDGLVGACNLESIRIARCVRLGSVNVFNYLLNLREIYILGCGVREIVLGRGWGGGMGNRRCIEELVICVCNLKKIVIDCDVVKCAFKVCNCDISFGECVVNELHLIMCETKRIDGIESVEGLRELVIIHCPYLDLSGVCGLVDKSCLYCVKVRGCGVGMNVGTFCTFIVGCSRLGDLCVDFDVGNDVLRRLSMLRNVEFYGGNGQGLNRIDVGVMLDGLCELESIVFYKIVIENIRCLGELKMLRKICIFHNCRICDEDKCYIEELKNDVCVAVENY